MSATENRAMFLAWLRENHPDIYSQFVAPAPLVGQQLAPVALSGFLDSIGNAFNSVLTNVTNSLPKLAETYSTYQQQRELLRINAERARAGQAPLTVNAQGQLITAAGIPYTEDEWRIAQSAGGIGTGGMIALGLAFALLLAIILKPSK